MSFRVICFPKKWKNEKFLGAWAIKSVVAGAHRPNPSLLCLRNPEGHKKRRCKKLNEYWSRCWSDEPFCRNIAWELYEQGWKPDGFDTEGLTYRRLMVWQLWVNDGRTLRTIGESWLWRFFHIFFFFFIHAAHARQKWWTMSNAEHRSASGKFSPTQEGIRIVHNFWTFSNE